LGWGGGGGGGREITDLSDGKLEVLGWGGSQDRKFISYDVNVSHNRDSSNCAFTATLGSDSPTSKTRRQHVLPKRRHPFTMLRGTKAHMTTV